MKNIYNDIISELRDKLKKIINLYESEKSKNFDLIKQNEILVEQIGRLENQQEDLHDKYDNLKLAKVISSNSDDVHSTKLKVNRIVREIDKCIALLNK